MTRRWKNYVEEDNDDEENNYDDNDYEENFDNDDDALLWIQNDGYIIMKFWTKNNRMMSHHRFVGVDGE